MTGVPKESGRLFALVLGLLAGVLATAVVVPKRQPEVVAVGSGDTSQVVGTGAGTSGPGVSGDDLVSGGSGSGGSAGSAGGDPSTAPSGGGVTGAGSTGAAGSTGEAGAEGAGGTDGGGGGGATDAGAGATGGGGPVRGVTDNTITIGVSYPDLTALKPLGEQFDNGDVEKQWRAQYDGWKRDGLVPVHGRDIKLVFRKYSVVSAEEQRAACIGLVQDDRAFAVVAQTYFAVGSECVAREMRTPLITSDGPTEAVFARSHPFLFSLQMSEDRVLRNLVNWADASGLLDGKTVGIYYEDRAEIRDLMNKTVKAELARLGHKLGAEASTAQTLGGPQDAVAVQRFRSAGVDVALLFTSKSGFMQQADAQAYRPKYLDSDYFFGTSDTTTSPYPPEQFDGALGMTGRRVGETPVGIPLGPEGDACLANYKRFSGEQPEQETTVWAYVLTGCDLGKSLMTALAAAGRDLTPQGLVAGLETMRNVPMTRYAPVSFTPDKHHGVDTQRTVRWEAGCACWKAVGDFQPLFVP